MAGRPFFRSDTVSSTPGIALYRHVALGVFSSFISPHQPLKSFRSKCLQIKASGIEPTSGSREAKARAKRMQVGKIKITSRMQIKCDYE